MKKLMMLLVTVGMLIGAGCNTKQEDKPEPNEPDFITTFPEVIRFEEPEWLKQMLRGLDYEEMSGKEWEDFLLEEWKKLPSPKVIEKEIVREQTEEEQLKNRLDYLYEIPEISWVKFERNSVYIGFTSVPSDLTLILGAAAFHGNKAIDFGVHVYAYDARRYGPTTGGNFFKGATCRYGKVKHY